MFRKQRVARILQLPPISSKSCHNHYSLGISTSASTIMQQKSIHLLRPPWSRRRRRDARGSHAVGAERGAQQLKQRDRHQKVRSCARATRAREMRDATTKKHTNKQQSARQAN